MDAKATASSSRFMPQSQEDKVQFQLEAFMFQEGNSPSVRTECLMNFICLLWFRYLLPVVSLADLLDVYSEGHSCFCTK